MSKAKKQHREIFFPRPPTSAPRFTEFQSHPHQNTNRTWQKTQHGRSSRRFDLTRSQDAHVIIKSIRSAPRTSSIWEVMLRFCPFGTSPLSQEKWHSLSIENLKESKLLILGFSVFSYSNIRSSDLDIFGEGSFCSPPPTPTTSLRWGSVRWKLCVWPEWNAGGEKHSLISQPVVPRNWNHAVQGFKSVSFNLSLGMR